MQKIAVTSTCSSRGNTFEHLALGIPYPVGFIPIPNSNYKLIESKIYAIQPLHAVSNPKEVPPTWIVNVEESPNGRVQINDTLSRSVFRHLSKDLPATLDLLVYEVTEIANAYRIELNANNELNNASSSSTASNRAVIACYLEKVVASEGLNEVMSLYTGGKLAVWRRGEAGWNTIDVTCFKDIIYHNQKFYAVDSDGLTIAVDCNTSNYVTIVVDQRQPRFGDGHFKHLIEIDQDLYLAVKYWLAGYPRRTRDVDHPEFNIYPVELIIYKLDEASGQWVEAMEGFENRVLFVGDGCCYSVLANEFPGTKRNSIYFSDVLFKESEDAYPGWLCGVYDIQHRVARLLSASPGYSGIFWPPPAWVAGTKACLRTEL